MKGTKSQLKIVHTHLFSIQRKMTLKETIIEDVSHQHLTNTQNTPFDYAKGHRTL